jgi:uncharacterized protein (DUF1800 family)
MYGASIEQINQSVDDGMENTVEKLISDLELPAPPVNYDFAEDIFTPIAETWVDKPYDQAYRNYRIRSLIAWTAGLIINEGMSVREKMTLFWHNHFVTADIPVPKLDYQYITLLRENSLGNFKDLVKSITINPSMLVYLNGNQNTKFAPNENYARELLELFTVGKGDLAGPGDYTTFTEQDVKEIARILTGWRISFVAETGEMASAFFNPFLHDAETKYLSHRFGNAQINNNGANELDDLIEVIFNHKEAANFICRKLYRWFIYYTIDDEVELNVIGPMAQLLVENQFEVKPVLRALFMSEHFYDVNSIGCIIKNPIEFLYSNIKQLNLWMPEDYTQRYALWFALHNFAAIMQMEYFQPPSVAGWKAYYQAPSFYQLWVNAATLPIRRQYTDVVSSVGFNIFDIPWRADVLNIVAGLSNPLNPNDLINDLAGFLLPQPLMDTQLTYLKNVLIPGLPDFEWTVEYNLYLQNPDDEDIKRTIELKLRSLLLSILAMPEYYLG